MSAGKKFYAKQIDKALASAKEINQDEHPRIVVFSDCHRGNGTWNDSFLNNKTLFQAALGYYRENDFTYIELGDGDELWENRKFSDIEEINADIFQRVFPFGTGPHTASGTQNENEEREFFHGLCSC